MFSRKRKPTGTSTAKAAKITPNPPLWYNLQNPNDNESGIGYGGTNADTQRLLEGRKLAEKASDVEDGQNTKFLNDATTKVEQWFQADNGDEQRTKLTSILADVFRNQVPTDWNHRSKLYKAALDLTSLLSSKQEFVALLGDPDDVESVVYWLDDFGQQAEQIVKHESTNTSNKNPKGGEKDIKFANRVTEVRDEALKMAKRYNCKPEEELTMISFGERYQGELGPMRFDTVESMDNHFFLKKIPNAPTTLNTRRLFKELASYRNALPVEYGSSAFCRVINNRLDLLRVMITGPDGTPYANGCFFFDINIPPSYPRVAPKVHFLTTGGGTIRFNPNLYNCGKVCLSLLGTWQGPGWISGESTLLQVLISIQSLILVPDPYFNEPGFESSRGTADGDARSKQYNSNIRHYTIHAAIKSHLSSILKRENNYAEFEGIMIKHFLEKRSLIEKELKSWAEADSRLASQVQSVLKLFASLSAREKEAKRDASQSKHLAAFASVAQRANLSTEAIELDDSDVEEVVSLAAVGKSEETIEIDLCDEDADNVKRNSNVVVKDGSNDVVDLT